MNAANWINGNTAVFEAAYRGNVGLVRLFCRLGADVGARTKEGHTLLHWAARTGADVVHTLVDAGADHAETDRFGDAPLHKAAFHGHAHVVASLLDCGADPTQVNRSGLTPKVWAALRGQDAVVKCFTWKTATFWRPRLHKFYPPSFRASAMALMHSRFTWAPPEKVGARAWACVKNILSYLEVDWFWDRDVDHLHGGEEVPPALRAACHVRAGRNPDGSRIKDEHESSDEEDAPGPRTKIDKDGDGVDDGPDDHDEVEASATMQLLRSLKLDEDEVETPETKRRRLAKEARDAERAGWASGRSLFGEANANALDALNSQLMRYGFDWANLPDVPRHLLLSTAEAEALRLEQEAAARAADGGGLEAGSVPGSPGSPRRSLIGGATAGSPLTPGGLLGLDGELPEGFGDLSSMRGSPVAMADAAAAEAEAEAERPTTAEIATRPVSAQEEDGNIIVEYILKCMYGWQTIAVGLPAQAKKDTDASKKRAKEWYAREKERLRGAHKEVYGREYEDDEIEELLQSEEEFDALRDVENLTKRETRAFKAEKKRWFKQKKAYIKGMKKLEPIMAIFRSGMLLEMRKDLAERHAELVEIAKVNAVENEKRRAREKIAREKRKERDRVRREREEAMLLKKSRRELKARMEGARFIEGKWYSPRDGCRFCLGHGLIGKEQCDHCDGTGFEPLNEEEAAAAAAAEEEANRPKESVEQKIRRTVTANRRGSINPLMLQLEEAEIQEKIKAAKKRSKKKAIAAAAVMTGGGKSWKDEKGKSVLKGKAKGKSKKKGGSPSRSPSPKSAKKSRTKSKKKSKRKSKKKSKRSRSPSPAGSTGSSSGGSEASD